MLKSCAAFVLAVLISFGAQSQSMQLTYGGAQDDLGGAVLPMADDGFLLVGATASHSTPSNNDLLVQRVDKRGKTKWSKLIGGAGDEAYFQSIVRGLDAIQGEDSSFLVVSSTTNFGAGGSDGYIIKMDQNGTVYWKKTYGGPQNDVLLSITKSIYNDGYYAVGQYKSGSNAAQGNAWVMKLDTRGNVRWSQKIGGPGNDYAIRLLQTHANSIYVVGHSISWGFGKYDYLMMNLDSSGHLIQTKVYGWDEYDQASDLFEVDGFLYIGGVSYSSTFGNHYLEGDVHLLKLDRDLNFVWGKHIGTEEHEGGIRRMHYDPIDNIILFLTAGKPFSSPGGVDEIQLSAIDTGRFTVPRWTKIFTTGNANPAIFANLISVDKRNKEITILAGTNGAGSGRFDWYFIKTRASEADSCEKARTFQIAEPQFPIKTVTPTVNKLLIVAKNEPSAVRIAGFAPDTYCQPAFNPLFYVTIAAEGLCEGDSVAWVRLHGLEEPLTATWHDSSKGANFRAAATGTYCATVADTQRNTLLLCADVVKHSHLQAPWADGLDTAICPNRPAVFSAPEGAVFHCPDGTVGPHCHFAQQGSHVVLYHPGGGCPPQEIQIDVGHRLGNDTVCYCPWNVPNAVSPNQDSINEVWPVNPCQGGSYCYEIYSRWGQRVHRACNEPWKPAEEGVYLYLITFTTPEKKNLAWSAAWLR